METGGSFGWKVLVMVTLLTAGIGGVLNAEATDCALAITDWEEYCCVEKVDEWSGTVKCTLTGDARQENIDEDLIAVWDDPAPGSPFTIEGTRESSDKTVLYLDLGLESGTTADEYTANVTFKGYYKEKTTDNLVCEASNQVEVTVIKVDSVEVSDENHPANSETTSGSSTPDLYVGETASHNAVLEVIASVIPDTTEARSRVNWEIDGSDASPDDGDFGASSTVKSTIEEGGFLSFYNRDFVVKAGCDCDDDGSLDSDEIANSVNVHLFEFTKLKVFDKNNSSVSVTVDEYAPSDELYICENTSGDTVITLEPDIDDDTSAIQSHVLWTITGDTATEPLGTFETASPDIDVTLAPDAGNTDRKFVIKAGTDDNNDGTLDAGEKQYEVKVIVVKVDLAATDLDGVVDDATEDSTGAYIHWNLDNDDSSDNSSGAPKRPGADYSQTGAGQITGEDDLKSLAMSLDPDLSTGSMVLTIDNAKGKVWKDDKKGSANLVLAGAGSKTWDLSNSSQKTDFKNLCSSLWVEGVDSGVCNIKLAYKASSGTEICSDTVKYTFIAADCGNQPTTTGTPSQRSRFEGAFSALIRCEWSITDATYPNSTYNCIAWSVGETGTWYNPWDIDQTYGDNDGIFENSDMDAFYNAKQGWQPMASGASDAEAMYYPYPGDWDYINDPPPSTGYHGAKRKGCACGSGKWIMFESKCGEWERIEHVWDQLNGSSYGSPSRFYK